MVRPSTPDLDVVGVFNPGVIRHENEVLLLLRVAVAWFPQIAYGIGSVVEGYLALADATGERRYAVFAGLTAGWFIGANAAGVAMYDEKSGRTFDQRRQLVNRQLPALHEKRPTGRGDNSARGRIGGGDREPLTPQLVAGTGAAG